MDHRRQREVERPQPEDREDVGGVDDVGVGGDGEDRRHRIHREDHVGDLDHHEGEEQRRRIAHQLAATRLRPLDEEAVALEPLGHAHVPAHEPQHRVVAQVRLVVGHHQHADAGEDEERREQVQHPAEFRDQRRAEPDHDRAQHDHPEDAPEQHPVLQFARDGEEAEDHRDDEDVVHREALFDDEPGDVFEPGGRPDRQPNEAAEGEPERDVEAREQQALAHPDLAIAAVEDAQVERQQHDDEAQEGQPHPEWLAEKRNEEELHGRSPLSEPAGPRRRRGRKDKGHQVHLSLDAIDGGAEETHTAGNGAYPDPAPAVPVLQPLCSEPTSRAVAARQRGPDHAANMGRHHRHRKRYGLSQPAAPCTNLSPPFTAILCWASLRRCEVVTSDWRAEHSGSASCTAPPLRVPPSWDGVPMESSAARNG